LARKCPKCHSENPETKQFCADCGTQLPPPKDHSPVMTETLQKPVHELTTGSTFAGRYQVIEELGRGGMGRVYKVHDTELNEKVALKLLRPEVAAGPETVERFRHELKSARQVTHKNVCRMFDIGRSEGAPYITMEYVPGEDLKRLIRKIGQMPAGRTVSIARQIAEGLAEAHHLGVVHRDLKPQNIMVDEGGNARIMDFGIARSLRGKGITGAGVMIGTPEYMSPEQVEGKDVDQRSDIYSLGIILYEMLTGRVPFEGDTPFTIGVKHKSEIPRDPRELNTQIPLDLGRLVLKCLEKDKEKRFRSAEELQSELTRIEDEIPTGERALPKRKPTRSQAVADGAEKSKWARIALYAGGVVGLALIVYVGLHLFTGRDESIDSIAVLPFENVNDDPDIDYLCDGITETIINKLSQLSSFKKVISRNSVFTYKGKSVDPRTVGKELGVKAVLLTRLVRMGDSLTISPTLVRTQDNGQLWGERYNRKFNDIFFIEEDMAASIIQALKLKLSGEERLKISARPIDNVAAYEWYLKSNAEIYQFSGEVLDRALQFLQNGLNIVGDNALLYAGIAFVYFQYVNIGVKQEDYIKKAEEYSNRALALDPTNPKAHVILGLIAYYFRNNQREGLHHFATALDADANDIDGLRWLSLSYIEYSGKMSLADPLIERLLRIDPLNPNTIMIQGAMDYYKGRYDLALKLFNKCYQMDPRNLLCRFFYGWTLAYCNELDEAFSIFDQSASESPTSIYSKFGLLMKSALRKDKDKVAQEMTPDFVKTCQRDAVFAHRIAVVFSLLDEKKDALDWLENAVNRGFVNYPLLAEKDLFLANIRGEERFKKLMERAKYEWEHFEE